MITNDQFLRGANNGAPAAPGSTVNLPYGQVAANIDGYAPRQLRGIVRNNTGTGASQAITVPAEIGRAHV